MSLVITHSAARSDCTLEACDPGWASLRNVVCVLGLAGVFICGGPLAWAEDRMTYRSTSGLETRTRTGAMAGYEDGEFRFQVQEGGELKVPASRVIGLEFEGSEEWQKGLEAWRAGRWQEAFDGLVKAYRAEQREWAKYEIQALIIRCAYATGRYALACQGFLQLLEDDPNTRHFHAIPLSWQRGDNDAKLIRDAETWLVSSVPLERLLGASWLLTTAKQPQALEVLAELGRTEDDRIASLAQAQAWRPLVPRADQKQLSTWRQAIQKLPADLQAGPQWLIAQAASRIAGEDRAAIDFLKIAVDARAQEGLRAEALLGAARQLRQTQPQEAEQLLKELKEKYSESEAWQLGQRL
jgi:tetratricopeptide (TPR) repeat protein